MQSIKLKIFKYNRFHNTIAWDPFVLLLAGLSLLLVSTFRSNNGWGTSLLHSVIAC